MVLRLATPHEVTHWDSIVIKNCVDAQFLHSTAFMETKADRWTPHYLVYEENGDSFAVTALSRHIFGLGKVLYFPAGPAVPASQMSRFIQCLEKFITTDLEGVFLVKIEPRVEIRAELPHTAPTHSIQPSSTIILPVTTDLNKMGRRARRYIRIGEREGIVVKCVPISELNIRKMYSLMGMAYGGKGMPGLRSLSYYRKFWKVFNKKGFGSLYFAYDNDEVVAGVFVTKYGKTGLYKDGGSKLGRQSKGATYLIHWKIIEALSDEGYTHYDLWGTPPSNEIRNPKHPLHGLAVFKTAFTDTVTDYIGVRDIVVKPLHYKYWKIFYPIYRRYLLRIRRESFY